MKIPEDGRVAWRALVLWALDVAAPEKNVYPTLYGPQAPRNGRAMTRYLLDRGHPDHEFFYDFATHHLEDSAALFADQRQPLRLGSASRLLGVVRVSEWLVRVVGDQLDKHNRRAEQLSRRTPEGTKSVFEPFLKPSEQWYGDVTAWAAACLKGSTGGSWPDRAEQVVAAVCKAGIDPEREWDQ